jgi:hypothetical protein
MGFLLLRLSFSSFLLVLGLVLNLVFVCNGGKSSSFVRKVEKAIDMPLDSDVFHVPSGYNAPQQVFFYLPFLSNLCLFLLFSTILYDDTSEEEGIYVFKLVLCRYSQNR